MGQLPPRRRVTVVASARRSGDRALAARTAAAAEAAPRGTPEVAVAEPAAARAVAVAVRRARGRERAVVEPAAPVAVERGERRAEVARALRLLSSPPAVLVVVAVVAVVVVVVVVGSGRRREPLAPQRRVLESRCKRVYADRSVRTWRSPPGRRVKKQHAPGRRAAAP